jgi:RNA polymerase sigma-70 factor (ECF subfamily)
MIGAVMAERADELDEDAILARGVRDGQAPAAGKLFDRHAALVRRILMRTLGPGPDVEDHVQDAFLCFFRELSGLRDDSAVRAFLVSITVRTARGELRKRRVRRILRLAPHHELGDAAGAGPGADMEGREAVRRLFSILDDLDTPSRLAFTLRHLEEMELTEIAAATGESLSSVKRRLSRVAPVLKARIAREPALAAYAGKEWS